MRYGKDSEPEKKKDGDISGDTKKVSKSIGEYVEYEEIKKDER